MQAQLKNQADVYYAERGSNVCDSRNCGCWAQWRMPFNPTIQEAEAGGPLWVWGQKRSYLKNKTSIKRNMLLKENELVGEEAWVLKKGKEDYCIYI